MYKNLSNKIKNFKGNKVKISLWEQYQTEIEFDILQVNRKKGIAIFFDT